MAANICIFQGHFVNDPEITRGKTQDNKEWVKARFKLGVNRFSDKEADFPEFYCFGAAAEFVGKYFKKGSAAIVESSFETGSYTDKDGQKVYTSTFRAREVNFG